MLQSIILKALNNQLCEKGSVELEVHGDSMYPTLVNEDKVSIVRSDDYFIGEIVVFIYKTEQILIHRLIQKDTTFGCKGDNSFRLETINKEMIIGKAVSVNNKILPSWPQWKCDFSYKINRLFFHNRYDIAKTKNCNLYFLYEILLLKKTYTAVASSFYLVLSEKYSTDQNLSKINAISKNLENDIISILKLPTTVPDLLFILKKEYGYDPIIYADELCHIIYDKVINKDILFYKLTQEIAYDKK